MPRALPISLTDEQWTALQWDAKKFGRTAEAHALAALAPSLTDMIRRYTEALWAVRRSTLDRDLALAATVDAKAPQ